MFKVPCDELELFLLLPDEHWDKLQHRSWPLVGLSSDLQKMNERPTKNEPNLYHLHAHAVLPTAKTIDGKQNTLIGIFNWGKGDTEYYSQICCITFIASAKLISLNTSLFPPKLIVAFKQVIHHV